MAIGLFLVYIVFTLVTLSRAWPAVVWEIATAVYLIFGTFLVGMPWYFFVPLVILLMPIIFFLHLDKLRTELADAIFAKAGKMVPKLSKTEEEALNAGDVWIEKSIFIGNPDWDKLASIETELTKEEQDFLDNETQTLCSMINEWEITQQQDLPETVWNYLKSSGFFGLVISREYGGKGFSARAHSDVVMKIASRCGAAAVSVMVPNSLGPGELLQYYGTDEQKSWYLPRLAKGEDIPCFALTEPGAGSDATSIQSEAIVMEKTIDGKKTLGLQIHLNKRWITLSPIATLIGLAVNLRDPDGLLGKEGEEGITCLLISRDTENLEIGNRHLPALQPFMNGTIRGENIFVPVTSIIGGQKMAGKGWQMLVECLSIGRSISLPALGAASSAVAYVTSGAFSRIRRQFNVEISQFEGIEEKLAEIAGLNYLIHSTRLLTIAAVNEHKKPSTASAITKYINTELGRESVNRAMDIHAGRAVVAGPRNYLTGLYMGIPISITVEGANIMSRNLLIFGQGSMACHPFIREEFYAVRKEDKEKFRGIFWNHVYYFMQNFGKMTVSGWTGGIFIDVPGKILVREKKTLTRLSHAFAFIADLSLIYLGGDLKRRERLSARLADALIYQYMAMAVIRNCEKHGALDDEMVHAQWALAYCFSKTQEALLAFCANFPSRIIGSIIRILAFPLGRTMQRASDTMDRKLARLMAGNNTYRDRLKQYMYLSQNPSEPIDRMEYALQCILENEEILKKFPDIKRIPPALLREKLQNHVDNNTMSKEEMEAILKVEMARWDAIQVDEFTFDSMKKKTFESVADKMKNPFMEDK